MSSVRQADPASGPARWRRVQDLFHAAADLPAAEQRAFLESRSEGDATLVAEVEALLVEDRTPGSFLDEERLHLRDQHRIAFRARLEERVLLGRRQVRRGVEEVLDPPPAGRAGGWISRSA